MADLTVGFWKGSSQMCFYIYKVIRLFPAASDGAI